MKDTHIEVIKDGRKIRMSKASYYALGPKGQADLQIVKKEPPRNPDQVLLEELRATCDSMGIEYRKNYGIKKLSELIEEEKAKVEAKQEEESNEATEE